MHETQKMRDEMLAQIMQLLTPYTFIDSYEGYQIVADLWREQLTHDIVIIAEKGFYEAGRTVIPNMVTKGSGNARREEQNGVKGAIVPNELIEKQLFTKELTEITEIENLIEDCDTKISEKEEEAKDENSEHIEIYSEILDDDGESIDRKKLKDQIKKNDKGKALLEEIENLFSERVEYTKKLKSMQFELENKVQDKIPNLTNAEIDSLMNEKWFAPLEASSASLVLKPVEEELSQVRELYDNYGTTLADIDNEIAQLDKKIAVFQKELKVTI